MFLTLLTSLGLLMLGGTLGALGVILCIASGRTYENNTETDCE